jgi:predicted homoserine dehydrogenase-like protein
MNLVVGTKQTVPFNKKDDLLPIGLSGGCKMKKGIQPDKPIRMTDVETPQGRLCDRLWSEQNVISNLSTEHIMGKG